MKNFDSLIRPQILGFEPYLPGRSIDSVKREHGLKHIIKLASNENPLGPSKKAPLTTSLCRWLPRDSTGQ